MQKYLQNHKSSDRKEVSTYSINCKPSHITVFCDLHKIHFLYLCLPHPPLQSILSTCDSATDKFSNYVTQFMQYFAEPLPSYICYSKYFIQLLESLHEADQVIFNSSPSKITIPQHATLIPTLSPHHICLILLWPPKTLPQHNLFPVLHWFPCQVLHIRPHATSIGYTKLHSNPG